MKMSLSEIRNLETELNWCSITASFYECKANKATNDTDKQDYRAKQNYFGGKIDAFLTLSCICGFDIKIYQVHHKVENCDFNANVYSIINNTERS